MTQIVLDHWMASFEYSYCHLRAVNWEHLKISQLCMAIFLYWYV
jgi:hypothetical protein